MSLSFQRFLLILLQPEIQRRLHEILYPPESQGRSACGYCQKYVSCRKRTNRVVTCVNSVTCGCYKRTVYCSEVCKSEDRDNLVGHKCKENVVRGEGWTVTFREKAPGTRICRYPKATRYVTTKVVQPPEVLTTPTEKPILFYPTCIFKKVPMYGRKQGNRSAVSCAGCLRLLTIPGGHSLRWNEDLPGCDGLMVWRGLMQRREEGFAEESMERLRILDAWKCKGCQWPFCSRLCAKVLGSE